MNIIKKIQNKIIDKLYPHKLKVRHFYGGAVDIKKPIFFDFRNISVGNNTHIFDYARMVNVSGNKDVKITIGSNTGILYRCTILAGSDVIIGNNVAIASDVFISSGSHGIDPTSATPYGSQPYTGKPVHINDNAWIGEKACILQGVTIGKGSIVGAGAVVTKNIPDYCIAVGNPAKVIKKYNFENNTWEKV